MKPIGQTGGLALANRHPHGRPKPIVNQVRTNDNKRRDYRDYHFTIFTKHCVLSLHSTSSGLLKSVSPKTSKYYPLNCDGSPVRRKTPMGNTKNSNI